MNTFQNCKQHKCAISLTKQVRQERTETGDLANEMAHSIEPHDRILNLVQLRSSVWVQQFRRQYTYPTIKGDELIAAAIENRKALVKAAAAQKDRQKGKTRREGPSESTSIVEVGVGESAASERGVTTGSSSGANRGGCDETNQGASGETVPVVRPKRK